MDTSAPFVDPRIFETAATTRADTVPVIVLFPDADAQAHFHRQTTRAATFQHVVEGDGRYLHFAAARMRRTEVEHAARQGSLQAVWLDALCSACVDNSVRHVGISRAWADFGVYGDGIRIGIADTGLDRDHPDFAGRIEGFRDFLEEGGPPDPDGHGTHVASVACGSGAASDGRYAGAAPLARILAARVLHQGGSGHMSKVMLGIEWLAASGAQVINLSVGAEVSVHGVDPLSRLCANLVEANIVVTVAAGNAGPFPRTIGSPGSAPRVITVGATDLSDQVTTFSSRGPTAQGLIKPDLVAPGFEVVAARARDTHIGTILNHAYTSMSGTSMAAPLVAGLAALMREIAPQLTASEIKAILQLHSAPLNLPVTAQGAGLLQADIALQSLRAPRLKSPDPVSPPSAPVPQPPAAMGCLAPRWGRAVEKLHHWATKPGAVR